MEQPIILFDGVCNLCNSAVDFILRHDRDEVFLFGSLQSESAVRLLEGRLRLTEELSTIVLLEGGRAYKESTAALRIARHLPWPWKLAYALVVVPPPLRDRAYRCLARNRYRVWGMRETCRVPTDAEKRRFIGPVSR
jgi:predicted DCC family thiol-disulfide oxidoreductase YuxK